MGTPTAAPKTLRERTRTAMRDEVLTVAVNLFAEQGFESVTTTQIATAAGISPRSFFRYFPTKEDVLLGSLREAGLQVRDALERRPDDEGAWDALLHAFRTLVEHPVYPQEHLEAISRIIVQTPSIRAHDLQKYQEWEELLSPDIARRLARTMPAGSFDVAVEEAARAIVGAAVAALRVATERWLQNDEVVAPIAVLDGLVHVIRNG